MSAYGERAGSISAAALSYWRGYYYQFWFRMKRTSVYPFIAAAILAAVFGAWVEITGPKDVAGDCVGDEPGTIIEKQEPASEYTSGYTREDVIRVTKDFFNVKPLSGSGGAPLNPRLKELKQALDDVFSVNSEERSVDTLDTLFQKILTATDLSWQEKIGLLWDFAKTRESDIEYQYVLENLAALAPIELVDPIIQKYQSEISKERKLALLSLLDKALHVGNIEAAPQEQQNYVSANFIQAQNFLKSSLYSENDSDLVASILSTYTWAAPGDSELANVARDFLLSQNVAGPPEGERRRLLLKVALENKNLQELLLPQILTASNLRDAEFNDEVNVLVSSMGEQQFVENELLWRTKDGSHASQTRTCLTGGAKCGHAPRLSELKNTMEGVFQQTSSDSFTDQGKAAFLEYIHNQQGGSLQPHHIEAGNELAFFNRLKALTTLQADGAKSAQEVLVSYVLDHYVAKQSNPFEISSVLVFSDETVAAMLKQHSPQILPILERALKRPSDVNSASKVELIMAALDVLKNNGVIEQPQ